ENGRSAIEELSHKIIALHALSNPQENVHVNVGLMEGGKSTNAVADYASCEVDLRISKKEQANKMEQAIRDIVSESVVEGVSASLTGGIRRLPMVYTEETAKLVGLIQTVASDLGLEIDHVATGGGSDASFIASQGIPTVDGLGPVGG